LNYTRAAPRQTPRRAVLILTGLPTPGHFGCVWPAASRR